MVERTEDGGATSIKLIQNPTDFTLGILLALVFALDIATTQICLSTGTGIEANPIICVVVDNPLLFIFVKGVVLCLIIYIVNKFKIYFPEWIGHFQCLWLLELL